MLRKMMGLRGMQRPPFLVRSLSYVREAKKHNHNHRGFDLRWVKYMDKTRTGDSVECARLILKVVLEYCALKKIDWDLFVPAREKGSSEREGSVGKKGVGVVTGGVRLAQQRIEKAAEDERRALRKSWKGNGVNSKQRKSVVLDMKVYLRLWLVIEDHDRHRYAAGVKETQIDTRSVEDDLRTGEETKGGIGEYFFDLGGILAVASASSAPRRVLLKVELSKDSEGDAILVSELCLFDSCRGKSWIPTLAIELPLKKTELGRKLELSKSDGEEHGVLGRSTQVDRHSCFEPEDWITLSEPPKDESYLSLSLCGQPSRDEHAGPARKNPVVTRAARIDLIYTAPERPQWKIVRHDFRCPFCLRHHTCLRSLWTHLSVDHGKENFSVRAAPDARSPKLGEHRRVKLRVTFKAGNYNIDPPTSPASDDAIVIEDDSTSTGNANANHPAPVAPNVEEIYVNPKRFQRYHDRLALDREPKGEKKGSIDVAREPTELGSECASDETDFDEDLVNVLPVRAHCLECKRLHSSTYTVDKRFCKDYCHVRYVEKFCEDKSKPLTQIADERSGASTRKRLREEGWLNQKQRHSDKINFKETLGRQTLYHETTYVPVTAEHYDACDGDSEEEIDESWRLDLLNERVVKLPNVEPSVKVFMKMWNKYMHEHPLHGDRYTRYQCEMFAFENGSEIKRLGLRSIFFDFIHECIYAYGLTDAEGVGSIFQALDGLRKRRDIAALRKPPMYPAPLVSGTARGGTRPNAGGPRPKQTNRNGKKRKVVTKDAFRSFTKGTRPARERPARRAGNGSGNGNGSGSP